MRQVAEQKAKWEAEGVDAEEVETRAQEFQKNVEKQTKEAKAQRAAAKPNKRLTEDADAAAGSTGEAGEKRPAEEGPQDSNKKARTSTGSRKADATNLEYLSEVDSALKVIMSHPAFKNICDKDPLAVETDTRGQSCIQASESNLTVSYYDPARIRLIHCSYLIINLICIVCRQRALIAQPPRDTRLSSTRPAASGH